MLQSSYPTYEEWKPKLCECRVAERVRSYPTYEEWKPDSFIQDSRAEFKGSYPTYEEWKQKRHYYRRKTKIRFLSYLWGMETCHKCNSFCFLVLVLILPMRNGNILFSSLKTFKACFGSYPTYEEWKRYVTSGEVNFDGTVLILPMRNGNISLLVFSFWFHYVLILPMRNGNYF